LNNQQFQTPIEYLKGVGLARAEVLKKELQIYNFEDLLRHFPYKYIDRTRFYKIKDIQPDMPYVQVLARVTQKEYWARNTPNV
jgi:ATP-dependent DNA helicase RecG